MNVVTMIRTLGIAALLGGIHLVSAAPALAQAVEGIEPAGVTDLCPRNILKIYFASGDVNASPQAEALIGKIGETASTCEPDHLDLVAHFDASIDGARAVSVALERLARVADDLVARGISADRIRISARAAKPGESSTSSLNQIDVLFRKADAGEAVTEPARPSGRGTAPSESI